LFLKMLLVFGGGVTASGVYLMASFWLFDWQQGRLSVRRTATNYAEFVLGDLADPPDTAEAQEVATRLGSASAYASLGLGSTGLASRTSPPSPTRICLPAPSRA
jgi:hypothetical protein